VQVIQGAHCAGITTDHGGRPFTAVHSDTLTLDIETHQYAAGDGIDERFAVRLAALQVNLVPLARRTDQPEALVALPGGGAPRSPPRRRRWSSSTPPSPDPLLVGGDGR